ncbi:MAG TPA: PAS domain S-box protein, partial [Draconibacterium sp.]|nr:PAS domain S-box protein [Draconibacterium sp.]
MIKKKDNGLNTWEELRLFLEQDLTGDFISTADGKLLVCNSVYLNILGFKSIEEANNFNLNQLYPTPAERNKIVELLKNNKSLKNYEYQMVKQDGQPVYLIANIYGEFDKAGNLSRIRGYMYDNTERIKAEDENLKLARAVEQSPALTIITDIDGKIEYVNSKFTEVTGYSKKEVIGKNPRILKSGQTNPQLYKQLFKTIHAGKEWKGEFLNRKKNGELFWQSGMISPVRNSKNEISHFLAVNEDITERKKSEQLQKVIFNISSATNTTENLEDLLEIIRQQLGILIDVSNFYMALYDKERDYFTVPYFADQKINLKEFPARKTLSAYVVKNKKPFLCTIEELKKLEKQGVVESIGAKSKAWMGVPLIIKGEVMGIFAVQSYENEKAYSNEDLDILIYVSNKISLAVERKKNEAQLKDALAKAQESDQLKSAFLATMSHELRTPLNAVIGFADLINKDANPSQNEEFG